MEVKTNKLSNLISKSVYQKKDKGKTFLFWLEGFNCDLRKEDGRDQAIITDEILIDKIKSDTRLPIWLDSYIFEDLHAKYEPDFRKFDYNLEHSTYDLLIYLGTYFPRSYAESFCIFDDIFSNETFNKEIRSKDELNILDIGCGTGGNLIGLLTAIKKHFSCVSTINVYAIDGNPDALKILESILNHFSFNYKFKINHTIFAETFKAVDEISETISRIQCESFDFIMSFKTMVEIISKGNGRTNNSYLRWLNLVSDLLISNGLALIADVTTKTDCSDYLPLLLNEQSRIFAKSKPEYKILSPRSCNCYSNLCTNSCFSQHEFSVSHSNKINDVSRIAYKIIGRSNFVDKVLIGRKKGKFIINWKQYNTGLLNGSICINSLGSDIFIDSYKIS